MKAKPFGAWQARNVGPGGSRELSDGFNRALKGNERAPRAKEYPMQGLPEYSRYPMEKDLRYGQDEQNKSAEQARKEQQAKNTNQLRSNMVRQVAGLVAGSVVITSSYQTMAAKRAERQSENEPTAVTETVETPAETEYEPVTAEESVTEERETTDAGTNSEGNQNAPNENSAEPEEAPAGEPTAKWSWSGDLGSAVIVFTDSQGKTHSVTAQIDVKEEVFCTKPGTRTYTATATDANGETFTDTQTEEIPAAGHDFVEEDTSGDVIRYKCSACGEVFENSFVVTPE